MKPIMHSMRFSDRTISYDTGLNLIQPKHESDLENEVGIVILPHNGATTLTEGAAKRRRPTKKTGKALCYHFLSFSLLAAE